MRASKLQCFALMTVMMVMMASSASLFNCTDTKKCQILLKDIQNKAKNLTQLNIHGKMPNILNGKCKRNFFCLAEKALENITHNNHSKEEGFKDKAELVKLMRLLKQYNIETEQTSCHLEMTRKYSLTHFLKDVEKCAQLAYNHTR